MADEDLLELHTAGLPAVDGFRLLKVKARTPKGVTYKARRLVEDDVVAVKIFNAAAAAAPFAEQLAARAEKTFGLECRGMVQSLGCIDDNGRLLLVSDYAAGQPLARFLQQGERFPPLKALAITLYCARTLRFAAERNFFHGRLHPNDVILGNNSVRILGIGLGERPEPARYGAADGYLFEPLVYTAPEAMPSQYLLPDQRAAVDVYALGALLFHMLAARPPFQGKDEAALAAERRALQKPVAWPAGLAAELYPEIVELTERMLAPEPAARPAPAQLVSTLISILSIRNGIPLDPAAPRLSRSGPLAALPSGTVDTRGTEVIAAAPQATSRVGAVRTTPSDRVLTLLLTGMTAVVFVCALLFMFTDRGPFGGKTGFRVQGSGSGVFAPANLPAAASEPRPSGSGPLANLPAPANPANSEPGTPTPEPGRSAQRQLDLVQAMLQRGEVQPSPALVRLANAIAQQAGEGTDTGVKAALFALQLDEKLKSVALAALPLAASAGDEHGQPTAGLPVPHAAPEQAKPPVDSAKVIAELPPEPQVTAAVKTALNDACNYQYLAARQVLEPLAAPAGASPAAACLSLIQREQALFERCRTRLAAQVAQNPKHESPLQFFPRKDDPAGDDIVDFDEQGLKIIVNGGAQRGPQQRGWDAIPPAQVFNLLQLLADAKSLEDQFGLAAFTFDHGLKQELETALSAARALNGSQPMAEQFLAACRSVSAALEK